MERQRWEPPGDDDQEIRLAKYCLDRASFCFFRYDADGRILYANGKACEYLGYSLTELLNMDMIDIDPSICSEKWPVLWQRLCDVGSVTFETIHRRKDGTTLPVEIISNLLEFEGYRFAISFVQDITERKQTEDALRLTQFAYRNASIGIFRTGRDGRILSANDHACRSLGYSYEELCTMTVHDIDPLIIKEERNALWRRLCDKGAITFETVHRRKDGTIFPVAITGNLLEFEGEKYSITFVRDITDQKNDEKQKAEMEAHLRQAQRMEALGTLAGGIAHDFNNILSGIFGYAQLAQLRCAKDFKLCRYIDQICAATDRAKNLVQQILAFSRQNKSEKKPIDLSGVIKETLKLLRATFPSTIRIRQSIKPNLGVVVADETQMHQTIMNLCTNAYHAMQKEGGLLEVVLVPATISSNDSQSCPGISPGKYLKLVVADTGSGMDQDTMARIFDPYFTTKRSDEGTGLGLSTVHGIIKDHGGDIKVYSEPGVGTTFQVFLPIAETESDQAITGVHRLPSGKECILFVDDEKLLLEIGKEMLEGLGYLVETRASPIDAMEAFRMNPKKFDLVISDRTMPKMTGEELAKGIKAIRSDIPIILCTGFSARISPDTVTETGINEVLMKPVTLSDLANTVRNVLDEHCPEFQLMTRRS